MPYCTESDILTEISEAELIGLTDDESTGAVIDAVVTAAIAKADALIDSYCGQVETVPFTTVPDIVQQHSVTIAIYFLYARRSAVPERHCHGQGLPPDRRRGDRRGRDRGQPHGRGPEIHNGQGERWIHRLAR
jgi:hypothetical protein